MRRQAGLRRDVGSRAQGARGFTLIEILIVVAIIAILAVILIPNFYQAQTQSKVSASKLNLRNLGLALQSYYTNSTGFPIAVSLSDAVAVLGTGALVPDYIREVPTDPCTGDPSAYKYKSDDGTTYTLSVDFPTGNRCDAIVGTVGDSVDLTYSPNGLQEGP